MNRRALLTTGVAAASVPAWGAASATATDPAVEAMRRWCALEREESRIAQASAYSDIDDDPGFQTARRAADAAFFGMIETRPTTLAGMAMLVRAYAFEALQIHNADADVWDTDTWAYTPTWADGRDHELLMAILAAGGQDAVWETQA